MAYFLDSGVYSSTQSWDSAWHMFCSNLDGVGRDDSVGLVVPMREICFVCEFCYRKRTRPGAR